MVVCSVLIGVLIIVVAVSAVMIVSGIIQPISQLNQATEKIAQGDFKAEPRRIPRMKWLSLQRALTKWQEACSL